MFDKMNRSAQIWNCRSATRDAPSQWADGDVYHILRSKFRQICRRRTMYRYRANGEHFGLGDGQPDMIAST